MPSFCWDPFHLVSFLGILGQIQVHWIWNLPCAEFLEWILTDYFINAEAHIFKILFVIAVITNNFIFTWASHNPLIISKDILHIWQAKGADLVQPGEDKTLGKPHCGSPVPKGGLQESLRGALSGNVVIGQGVMTLN